MKPNLCKRYSKSRLKKKSNGTELLRRDKEMTESERKRKNKEMQKRKKTNNANKEEAEYRRKRGET